MLCRRSLCALLFVCFFAVSGRGADAQPYVGEWSNGRGEIMVITAKTLKFGKDKPVPYRDITRASDGKFFQLQINSEKPVNYFSRFLRLTLASKEEMKMEGAATFNGEAESSATWYRE